MFLRLSLLAISCTTGASVLALGNEEIDNRQKHRHVQTTVTNSFSPLECNAKMSPCKSFVDDFGTGPFNDRVTIECGECYTLDHFPGTLTFTEGLDIRGKLEIPESSDLFGTLTIQSPLVLVQGELSIFATKAVNGIPSVSFSMTGDSDEYFSGADSNSGMCGGKCLAGKRSITVAGGKVDLHGIPSETPTFTKLFDVDDSSTIIISADVAGKWDVGADIVITSNTQHWWAEQRRTIASIERVDGQGQTRIGLNEPISRPSTIKDDVGFAVEVALLSRNIVFDSEEGGGHFWIMQTPLVEQMIEGVEIINFGQQGTLGKYPLHFHMCGDVTGSKVLKNSVWASNQRCYVVHGSDNLLLQDNVAYDTKGHCYMTEDGIETGNKFIRNIGIRTSLPDIVIPDNGFNGEETDKAAATFWITNPSNTFIDNIAAGSHHFGVWFELMKRGTKKDAPEYAHINPMQDPVTEFRGNEFHSIGTVALKFYLNGYTPLTDITFSELQFNRNSRTAIDFHFARYLHITNSTFQDNALAFYVDRADGIQLRDSTIVGHSKGFADVISSTSFGRPEKRCIDDRLAGIVIQETSPWGFDESLLKGLLLSNVNISGFEEDNCGSVTSVGLDKKDPWSHQTFEMYATFEDVNIESGSKGINLCSEQPVSDHVYISDKNGPESGEVQTLLRNSEEMTRFLRPEADCTEDASVCMMTCKNICFRSVHFYMHRIKYPDYTMKVCERGDRSNCFEVPGLQFMKHPNKRYAIHVPSEKTYDVNFVDKNGEDFFPPDDEVGVYYQDKRCPTAPDDEDIRLLQELPTETSVPVATPTVTPTASPVAVASPTASPTAFPTASPTASPVAAATKLPTQSPIVSADLSGQPTRGPTSADDWYECISLTDLNEANIASAWRSRKSGFIEQSDGAIRWTEEKSKVSKAGPEFIGLNNDSTKRCMTPGSTWHVRAKIKMVLSGTTTDPGIPCDLTSTKRGERCPVFIADVFNERGDVLRPRIARYVSSTWDPDGYNEFVASFTIPSTWTSGVTRFRSNFGYFTNGADIFVRDFEVIGESYRTRIEE